MAKSDVETSRIYDGVRDSKIHVDISSKLNQWSDTLLPGSIQASTKQRHHRKLDVHQVERDFARLTVDEFSRRIIYQSYNEIESNKRFDFNSKSDEGESWFHGCNGSEDPFHGFYYGDGESDSLIARFKRNLPVFDGFWHVEDLLTWIDAIDDFFEEVSPPENLKCKIVWYKMKGAAYYWWKMLQKDRLSEGKSLISSWPLMKQLLVERFMPTKDIEMEAINTGSCGEPGHSEEKGPANELHHTATTGKFVKVIVEDVGQSTVNFIENENSDKSLMNEQSIEKKEMKPAKCSINVSTESNADNSDYLCLSATDTCKVHISGNMPNDVTNDSCFLVSVTLDACKVPKCGVVPYDDSRHDALVVDKEENAQFVASELVMKKAKSDFAVATQFLVSTQSTREVIHIVTETRKIISKLKLGSPYGLESIVEEGNEASHAKFMDRTLQDSPITVAIVDGVYIILHDQVSHNHEEQHGAKWSKWVNRFGGGLSSFSDDNKNPTRLLGGMCMVSLNVVTELVLLLFDPGGVSSIMGNFSNYFSLSFNILDCIILRIDTAVEILSLRNSSMFTGYCFGNVDWHSNIMLKDKIAVKIVLCSFVWLGNSCDSLASFMMVISVLFRSRKESVLMDWTERGWFCKIEWPGGETLEYEFVIVGKKGHLTSEHADIRKWLILENNRHFEVDCQWNLTREALDLVPLEQSEEEHGDVEFAVFDGNITSGIISSTAVDQWNGKAVSFVSSKEHHDRERKRMWDTYGLRDVVLFGPHGLLYVRCPQILTHTDSPYTFLVDFWSVLKSDMPLKVLRYHDFAHLVDRSLYPLYTEDVFSSVCRFDLSIEGLFTCCSHMPQDVVCFMKDQKQRMVCHVVGICNSLYMTTFYSYMLPRLTCRQQCTTFVALLFMVEGKTSLMLWVLMFKLRLHVTLGRAILEAGWDVKNRSNKLNMAQRSVVTISSCLNILCTNRRLREYLTLFYKVVNGLDPPMNLIGTFFPLIQCC